MEILLNLIWLACALVLSGILAWRLARQDRCSAGSLAPWQSVITLACALTILFPIISMTDDLHDQQCLVEEAQSRRSVSQIRSSGRFDTHAGGPELWLGAFWPAHRLAPLCVIVGRVEEAAPPVPVSRDAQPSAGRAPPAFPL